MSIPPTIKGELPAYSDSTYNLAFERNEGFNEGRARAEIDEFGVYNSGGFRREGPMKVSQAQYNGNPAGLVMADLDGLKAVNDELGHPVGDGLIIRAKAILRDMMADPELPDFMSGRVGGDEFAMLVYGDEEQTRQVAEEFEQRYRSNVEEPENGELKERGVALSVGYSTLSEEIKDFSGLMKASDINMYENKVAKLGELNIRDELCLKMARWMIKLSSKKRLRDAPKYWRILGVLD